MNIYLKLINIQNTLKAPKNQYNAFGKYKYRSCEDILEAVKPILRENNAVLILNDEVVSIEGRFYVKATAKLIDADNGEIIETTAFAREEDTKKGMDSSQITGSCSSYARKYALNALFLIDDTKDSDYTNTHDKPDNKTTKTDIKADPKKNKIDDNKINQIKQLSKELNITDEKLVEWTLKSYNKTNLSDLDSYEYERLLNALQSIKNDKK